MLQKRDINIDVLRTLIIVSAFIIHFNGKLNIYYLAIPSAVVQKFIFTVGGFFFFTAGYMSRITYFRRYMGNPDYSFGPIYKKGIGILVLYITYIFVMTLLSDSQIPKNPTTFLFDHIFYTKVLFTFGILYLITPVYLYCYRYFKSILFTLIVLISFIVVFYTPDFQLPHSIKIVFIDRELFLYPVLPSLIVYTVGFLIAEYEASFLPLLSHKYVVPTLGFLIIFHLFLCLSVSYYTDIVTNRQYFTFIESFTPYIFLILVKDLCKNKGLIHYISSPKFLCIGIYSLHFYVGSNFMLGLADLSKNSAIIYRIFGLLIIGLLAYLLTLWKVQSSPHYMEQASQIQK